MLSEQSDNIFLQYEKAKEKLASVTNDNDIAFYTLAKKRAMKMMRELNNEEA